jgi:hypothetical protein
LNFIGSGKEEGLITEKGIFRASEYDIKEMFEKN